MRCKSSSLATGTTLAKDAGVRGGRATDGRERVGRRGAAKQRGDADGERGKAKRDEGGRTERTITESEADGDGRLLRRTKMYKRHGKTRTAGGAGAKRPEEPAKEADESEDFAALRKKVTPPGSELKPGRSSEAARPNRSIEDGTDSRPAAKAGPSPSISGGWADEEEAAKAGGLSEDAVRSRADMKESSEEEKAEDGNRRRRQNERQRRETRADGWARTRRHGSKARLRIRRKISCMNKMYSSL